jgi:hypothetical protein
MTVSNSSASDRYRDSVFNRARENAALHNFVSKEQRRTHRCINPISTRRKENA